MFISKLLPQTGNPLLDFIKEDRYYCYLVPLTVVVYFAFTVGNWLYMKHYRHA
jgi:phosphatidylinositol glycan anchor class Y biosynthesis protein